MDQPSIADIEALRGVYSAIHVLKIDGGKIGHRFHKVDLYQSSFGQVE